MGRWLQNWLNAHGLGAIALAVVVIAFVLSILMLGIGYLLVR